MHTPPPAADFLGCPLHPISVRDFIAAATGGARLRIAYLNAHTSNLAARDSHLRDILRACDIVYADGQAVVWAARLLGIRAPERVNAGDFITRFLQVCAEKGLRVYLLGSKEGVAQRAAEVWQHRVPGLEIAGSKHGFFAPEESPDVAARVREARADVLLIGMGSPQQEQWMAAWGDATGAGVVWCVGALFEYDAGAQRRAPRWMRGAGLEWLFRLAMEPGRLWRRYLMGNAVFIWRVLRARLRK